MGLLSFLGDVYDLDTLDTRLTTPSSVPYSAKSPAAADEGRSKKDDKRSDSAQAAQTSPSRWATPEFILYYALLSYIIPKMFWIAYSVSRPSDPRYHKYEHLLDDGWIPGRKIDVSDPQYHLLRQNFGAMAGLLLVHPLLRKAWEYVWNIGQSSLETKPAAEAAGERKRQRVSFDFVFALIFLVVLHGFSAAKVLLILGINHKIATQLPRKYVPATTWVFNIGILLLNEIYQGYKFRNIALFFSGPSAKVENLVSGQSSLVQLGEWLDSHGGLMSRWEVLFNITVLRLISFNLDYYWSVDHRSASPIEKKQLDPANLSDRDRVSIPAPASDFTFRNYVAYAVYAPLYLTGPILTFNDYMSQQRYRSPTISTPRTLRYGLRFIVIALTMELVLHFDYVSAISKASPDWGSYTPAQVSMLSFFNLHVIWLKLLLPWRFFRLWALVDGIDPPENLVRCVSNNFSTLSFWRSWHRSYNRWLLRYIYIPLGGANFRTYRDAARSVATYLMVFTFVALWHDINMKLIIWSWLIVLFFLPEIGAKYLFPKRKWESRPTAYRMLCCVGAVGNVLMMISANLVGFAVGADGLKEIVEGIFRDYSGKFELVWR
ncbi:MBOAT, membrane-bound O-acyltransferase family-domain-containing protein [Cercophora newfieldiana]|uniref:MBOAT, membrane-bound O-acyltransferase family-domain-containing protein n=1 Tax=Cercophora newfieldiana TaxID=92897 RepID=A0AA39YQ38_9PEZI|nr:MBOAT, membrane-bound O-acyltransferase family-domain-containing protein [Cercophora newfieldiana]